MKSLSLKWIAPCLVTFPVSNQSSYQVLAFCSCTSPFFFFFHVVVTETSYLCYENRRILHFILLLFRSDLQEDHIFYVTAFISDEIVSCFLDNPRKKKKKDIHRIIIVFRRCEVCAGLPAPWELSVHMNPGYNSGSVYLNGKDQNCGVVRCKFYLKRVLQRQLKIGNMANL